MRAEKTKRPVWLKHALIALGCILVIGLVLVLAQPGPAQPEPEEPPQQETPEQPDTNDTSDTNDTTTDTNDTEEPGPAQPDADDAEDTEPEPEPEPEPKPEPETVTTAYSANGSFSSAGGLTEGQKQAILDYMDSYYQSLAGLSVKNVGTPFYGSDVEKREQAIWRTIIRVRSSALEDLSLSSYHFTLRLSELSGGADSAQLVLIEDNQQQFRGLSVLTEQFNVRHEFTLRRVGGLWQVAAHSCNNGLFYNFVYDGAAGMDQRMNRILSLIEARHAQFNGQGQAAERLCDHPYDHAAAQAYALQWIGVRSGSWPAFDSWGGNCMNLASQSLLAGGIPMNGSWYCYNAGNVSSSWVNVGGFTDYAVSAPDTQLVCDAGGNYYDGQPGDLLMVGIDNARSHATVITGLVKNSAGQTIDYLVSCNTNDLRNFPAGAYHSANQRLFRIFGWNDG